MELKKPSKTIIGFIKKYKHAILVLIIGIGLMLYPGNSKKKSTAEQAALTPSVSLEDQLSEVLSCVKGAGKVKVVLSVMYGEETVYQTDQNTGQNSTKTDTVTIDKSGLVRRINPPVYLGALVLCQGADDPQVRLAIVDAVSKITGIGANRISVLKMK